MKFLSLFICCTIISALSITCSGTKQEAPPDSASSSGAGRPAIQARNIPPNTCRLIGTVVSIDEEFRTGGPDDPCSKAPCLAVVRIESIIGYGPAFGQPLAIGREIPVLFKFTVLPTEDFLPELSRHYPGLTTGSRFRADLESLPDQMNTGDVPVRGASFKYIIYGYELP